MGAVHAKGLEDNRLHRHAEQPAGPEYKHDPLEGFENGRKPRVIKATDAEMESAKVPLDKRDYCVDYLLKYMECRNDKFPWFYKCHDEKHEYLHCQYEDYIIRMKEQERARRLDERAAKAKAHEE